MPVGEEYGQHHPRRWRLGGRRSARGSPEQYQAAANEAGALAVVGGGILTLIGLIGTLAAGKTLVGILIVCVGSIVVLVGWIRWLFLRSRTAELVRRQEQSARHGLRLFPVRMGALSPEDAGSDRLDRRIPYVPRTAHVELEKRLEDARAAALAGRGIRLVFCTGRRRLARRGC